MMTITHVTGGSGPLDVDVLAGLHVVVLESGLDSESVGYNVRRRYGSRYQMLLTTEEVSLGLDKVGGKGLGSVTVEEGESGGVGRDGNTPETGNQH